MIQIKATDSDNDYNGMKVSISYSGLKDAAEQAYVVVDKLDEYREYLENTVLPAFDGYPGDVTANITSARSSVQNKISNLQSKADAFRKYGDSLVSLTEVCNNFDKLVRLKVYSLTGEFKEKYNIVYGSYEKGVIGGVYLANGSKYGRAAKKVVDINLANFDQSSDAFENWWDYEGGGDTVGGILSTLGQILIATLVISASIGTIMFGTGVLAITCAGASLVASGIELGNGFVNLESQREANILQASGDPAAAMRRREVNSVSDYLRSSFQYSSDGSYYEYDPGKEIAADVIDDVYSASIVVAATTGLTLAGKNKLLQIKKEYGDIKGSITAIKESVKDRMARLFKKPTWSKTTEVAAESGTKGIEAGYSNFADGMSVTDRAKYIQNNEAKFLEEFSERASTSGLSETQISEAFDAMKAGDYKKMVTYFDTSSPVDGAVFWSGNKEGAAAYADGIGGTILEKTPGGSVFDNWRGLQGMYPEWATGSTLDQKPIWEALSKKYAQDAVGDVTYVHILREGKPYYGTVWNDIEKKNLIKNMKNGKITNITEVIIDAK